MSTASIKIVFFDIDDTLYRKSSQTVPHSALGAIRQLRKNGIHTAIATGRSLCAIPVSLQALIDDGTFDVVVSINGQYNIQLQNGERKILSQHPMDKDFIMEVVAYCQAQGIDYAMISESDMVGSSNHALVQQAMKGIGDIRIDPDYAKHHDVYQMLLFADAPTLAKYHHSGIHRAGFETLRWHPYGVDLVQKNGAKSRGIQDVCTALSIPLDATMAFGDGHNDVEMMQYVGIGVAMGDALDEVKTVAKYITGTIEEDGIANALKQFGLIA